MFQYLMARLSEASTWRGVIAIVMASGVALNPGQIESIVTFGLGLIGVIGAFFPDKKKKA